MAFLNNEEGIDRFQIALMYSRYVVGLKEVYLARIVILHQIALILWCLKVLY